jgi:two-component system OmpR family response regulator
MFNATALPAGAVTLRHKILGAGGRGIFDAVAMTKQPHLLVVDDDREIRQLLSGFFARHGFRVSTAEDGKSMRQVLGGAKIDLVVLDVMLPGEDGLSLCREVRSQSQTSIIMLTAMGEEVDRILGLEMGADDYMPKPFSPRELLARVKAVLRRSGNGQDHAAAAPATLGFEGWQVNVARRQLHSPDKVLVQLSAGEFDLLVAFAEHPQRVLTRDQLLDLTRGRIAGPFDRSIDVQVSRLRRKIEPDPKEPVLIKTVRSGGYIFTPAVTRA